MIIVKAKGIDKMKNKSYKKLTCGWGAVYRSKKAKNKVVRKMNKKICKVCSFC